MKPKLAFVLLGFVLGAAAGIALSRPRPGSSDPSAGGVFTVTERGKPTQQYRILGSTGGYSGRVPDEWRTCPAWVTFSPTPHGVANTVFLEPGGSP